MQSYVGISLALNEYNNNIINNIVNLQILLNFGDKINEGMKKNAVLTFATLVNRVCKAVTCEPALVDGYVRTFFTKLRGTNSLCHEYIYLREKYA
jgi:hypothetical protein